MEDLIKNITLRCQKNFMDKNSRYYKQVQLLLRILPFIANQSCFALKGGTAINLFVRDFPRLSVDINLVYLLMC